MYRGFAISVDVCPGSPGTRDADRIMAAIQAAGVKQIDHLILTHYHCDHVGRRSTPNCTARLSARWLNPAPGFLSPA
jgi:L-ascorbate metabolism protein UlaG (beta-lactamase superfamily)